MMGIVLPETCWACNKICNKYHLLHLVGTLFPHNKLYRISAQTKEEVQNFMSSNVTHHVQNPISYYDHGYVRGRNRKSVRLQFKLIFMWVKVTPCYLMEIPNEEFKILPLCKPDLYWLLFLVNATLMNTVRLTLFCSHVRHTALCSAILFLLNRTDSA